MTITVHVKLLDEGVDVWRPVEAEHVSGNLYRLIGKPDDTENWEFETGSTVRVEKRLLEGGTAVIAVEAAT